MPKASNYSSKISSSFYFASHPLMWNWFACHLQVGNENKSAVTIKSEYQKRNIELLGVVIPFIPPKKAEHQKTHQSFPNNNTKINVHCKKKT